MKNILVISSSPRRHGNSSILCDEFINGAEEAGNKTEKIYLADLKIYPCKGCGVCSTTGKCVQKDDMKDLLAKMAAADAIVLATPVYFYCMFQKEVARRITAVPGTAEYGFLTLCSGMRASAELVCDVRPGSFRPVPAVDSSVLFFRPSRYFSERERELDFIKTVKCSFAHRRKTLANSLALCGFDRQKTEKALSACGIDKKSRAQELTFEQYAALSGTLCAD